MRFKPNTRPKSQRIAKEKLGRLLQLADLEDDVSTLVREKIPQAWHRLEYDIDVEEPKVKITLRMDRSVAKFYRAMGKGYQERINRILATYAQAKIADCLTMEENFYQYVEQSLDRCYDPVPDDIEEGPEEREV